MSQEEVKELLLEFESLSNRHQNKDWLLSLERLVNLGAEPFLSILSETSSTKEDRPIRWAIALILGKTRDHAAVQALCRLLDDLPSVQSIAAHGLGSIGSTDAVDALIQRLSIRENPKVVRNVAEALEKIGDARAIEPIRAVLAEVQAKSWGGVATPNWLTVSLNVLETKHGLEVSSNLPLPKPPRLT